MKELIWKVFMKTGSITSYLAYKEFDNNGVSEENERGHQASTHSGSGAALH